MTRARSLVLAGLALGLLAGLALAAVVPRTRAAGGGSPGRVLRTAPALGPLFPIPDRLRPEGRTALVARRADPDGGPDWAVRVGTLVYVPQPRFHRRKPAARSEQRCAQAVRLVDGRPGWLDADGTWRPVAFSPSAAAPVTCFSVQGGSRARAVPVVLTTLRRVAGTPAFRPLRGVVLALGPAGGRSTVAVGSTRTPLDLASGATLRLTAPGVQEHDVRLDARRPDGSEVPAAPARGVDVLGVTARAPDPAGGPPYLALVGRLPSPAGERDRPPALCFGSDVREVAGRAGGLDLRLGVLTSLQATGLGCGSGPTTARRPIALGYGFGPQAGPADDPDRVRTRLRPGRIALAGQVRPGVDSVTITTARDVRTLTPTGPLHAILAVYDGAGPGRRVTLTARWADGHTTTQVAYVNLP